MIFYFSGTGNSRWVAKELSNLINDNIYDICEINEVPNIDNEKKIGFIFPIYAWGVPEIMMNFVKKLNKTNAFTFSICTCGAEAGNALKQLSKIYKIDSCYSLVMPSNYIIGEDIEDENVIKEKIEKTNKDLINISKEILERQKVYSVNEGSSPKIKSGIINKAFNKFGRTTKPFYVDKNKCISCGLCSKMCPSSCITMVKGYPVWGTKCYQCLRCINYCPKEAIQYGKNTEKRGRYTIEKYLD